MIHVRVSNFSILGVILTMIGLLVACSATDEVGPAIARAEDLRETHSPVLIRALDQGSTEDRVRAAIAMGRVQDDGYAAGLDGQWSVLAGGATAEVSIADDDVPGMHFLDEIGI